MNDSRKQNNTQENMAGFEKTFISEKSNDIAKENKDKVGDDDVELRKHSRPYRSLMRNRKMAFPISESQQNTANQKSPSNIRSKSLSWYKAGSIYQPQFSSNLFSKLSSKQNGKLSVPLFASFNTERAKR